MPAACASSSIETSSYVRSLKRSTPSATSCLRRSSTSRRARAGTRAGGGLARGHDFLVADH